jgi:hypothetical protein
MYIHVDGTRYEGQWKDDLQDGFGTEIWPDGSRYEGLYVKGKKHGQGTYTWPDGSKYNGNWQDNKICGQVTIIFILIARVFILLLMEESMKVNGKTI